MSHPGHGETVGGVAGAAVGGPVAGAGLGEVGEGILPFTGSVLALPIALVGLLLTLAGWLLTRLYGDEAT